ncbi:hypothetical protein M0802_006972 [Mischocyttarus mexicanus]|nr:hypothetical protein M0802_006972 [Mischocyttarus mexicanus]
MNTLKLIIILMCYGCFASDTDILRYCFQFTWPGPMSPNSNKTEDWNCTDITHFGMPCIEPLILKWTYPNTTEMYLKWDKNIDEDTSIMCPLQEGFACIKYTNIYNNAVLYASHYCGRLLEDKTVAISSGCFDYEVDGHIIEACACQSQPGEKPCNTAIIQIASTLMLFPSIIILLYYFHPV